MKQKITLMLVCLFGLLTKAAAAVDSDLLNLVTKPSNVTITSLTNDPAYPWEMQEDGSFKRIGNYGSYSNKASEITLEMSCAHPTIISFSYVQSLYYSGSDKLNTIRDGIVWTTNTSNTAEGSTSSNSYMLQLQLSQGSLRCQQYYLIWQDGCQLVKCLYYFCCTALNS